MKKILSLICVMALSFSIAFAAEPTNYDSQQINSEFEQLNKIENYVQANGDVTLSDIEKNNANLLEGINLEADAMATIASKELPGGIPAFWWGCILTVLGVILVYVLTDNDKDQTKKALFGCLVTGGAWILYIVVWGVILGRSGAYWW